MYNEIAANKRLTWILLAMFVVVIIILGGTFGVMLNEPSLGLGFAGGLTIVMGLVGWFKGDAVALAASGAKEINKSQYPDLWNIVDNLAITDGLPTPKIYVIDDPAPNAFATGRDPAHASVAVTTGLLSIMDRSELEGVMAHELSHIKNYDIRVMTIVVVLVGSILMLSDIIVRSSFSKHNDQRKNNSMPIVLIIGTVLAALSPLFSQLIKLAISRQREYLADASGALATRYPEGLASALEKIAALDRPLKNANHATAHLFLANPFDPHVTKRYEIMFSTHPPLEERIKRLRSMGV